MYFVSVVNK